MSESKSSELPLSETPYKACLTTQDALRSEGHKLTNDCPGCAAFGIRCLVLSHPLASPGNGYSATD